MSGARPVPPPAFEEALARLDRRAFLRLAGGVSAAGLLGSGCGGVPAHLRPPAGLALACLSPRGYAVFSAAAMRLVGPRGAEEIRARRIEPARTADAWLARRPGLAGPLASGLWLLEYGAFPLLRKLRPFTALDGDAQDRVLAELLASRLDLKRDLFKGIRSIATLSFYGDPRSHSLVGYPGPFGPGGAIEAAMTYPVET